MIFFMSKNQPIIISNWRIKTTNSIKLMIKYSLLNFHLTNRLFNHHNITKHNKTNSNLNNFMKQTNRNKNLFNYKVLPKKMRNSKILKFLITNHLDNH